MKHNQTHRHIFYLVFIICTFAAPHVQQMFAQPNRVAHSQPNNKKYAVTERRPMSVARVYPYVLANQPSSFWDVNNWEPTWRASDDYEITYKLGEGSFGDVYKAYDKRDGQKAVVKFLKPIKDAAILLEIKLLQYLKGGPNMIDLKDTVRDKKTDASGLVFEFVNNKDFEVLYPTFTDYDCRFYMYQTLQALDYAHSKGVMHRDIKPQNVMIDHQARKVRLIDWGLGEFYLPLKEYEPDVGSRYFKAPELFLGMKDYDYSVDIFSLGVMFASMIFLKTPFFDGEDDVDQLMAYTKVLGVQSLMDYVEKYQLPLSSKIRSRLRDWPRRSFAEFVNKSNRHLISSEALDLVSRMITFDHQKRLTASEAVGHRYFDPVREAAKA